MTDTVLRFPQRSITLRHVHALRRRRTYRRISQTYHAHAPCDRFCDAQAESFKLTPNPEVAATVKCARPIQAVKQPD